MQLEHMKEIEINKGIPISAFMLHIGDYKSSIIKNRKIVLFGSGLQAYIAEQCLLNRNISLDCFADNNVSLWNRVIRGKMIKNPQDVFHNKGYYLIIASENKNINSVRMQFFMHGIFDYSIFFFSPYYRFSNPMVRELYIKGIENLCLDIPEMDSLPLVGQELGGTGEKLGSINYLLKLSTKIHGVLNWVQKILKQSNQEKFRVLDIGPGKGLVSYLLLSLRDNICVDLLLFGDKNNELHLIDRSAVNGPLKLQKTFSDRVCVEYGLIELENIPFNRKYDLIVMTEVFEHFALNPVHTLKKIAKVLQDKGSILIATPDWGHIQTYATWKEMPTPHQISIDRYCKLCNWGHNYQYNFTELEEIFTEAGLKINQYERSVSGNHNFYLSKE